MLNLFRESPSSQITTPSLAARRVFSLRLRRSGTASGGAGGGLLAPDGVASAPGMGAVQRKAPKTLREAIVGGDVLAVGAIVRAMTQEEAEVELVAQDR